jgi:elongation factor G
VGHILKLQGKEQKEMSKGIPGDICAVAKVEEIHLDAVLHDSHEEDYLHIKPLEFPVPVFGLAIHAKTRGDEQRLGNALHRVVEEDACLEIEHNVANNETILRGLGELHLRLTLEKMKDRFNVEVDTQPPKISYKETISAPAEGHHRHKKQTGGAGQFGEVYLRIAPLERGAGFQFVDEVKGGVIPSGLIPAVEKGVLQAINEGVVAGYAIQDVKVTVYDGKYHSVDSKEVAFVAAGKKAFQSAVAKAKPILLEPVVMLDLVVPDETMGAVTGDLSGKRGQLLGTDAMSGGLLNIKAKVPLSEIGQYANELNSITGGRGSYTLEFSHYQQVPHDIQKALADEYKPAEVED